MSQLKTFLVLSSLGACLPLACSDGDPIGDSTDVGSGGSAPGKCDEVVVCDDAADGGAGGEGAPACTATELQFEFQGFPLGGAKGVTDFVFLPGGGGKFLLASREGSLFMGVVSESGVSVPHEWSVPDTVFDEEACGLTNLLLDPDFDEDGGFVYMSYCSSPTNTRLVRYTWSEGGGLTDRAVVFETDLAKETDSWHRFGSMGFEEDGKTLWLLAGDHFQSKNGQDVEKPMGSVLRIVPSRKAGQGGFEPASGNLISVGDPDANPSVYAKGLRSPWRGTRDGSGRIWIGDVGLARYEEVNLATEPGQNFGWDLNEGPCALDDCSSFTDPLVHYGRTSDEPYVFDDPDTSPATKRAIWVGEIYRANDADPYCGLLDDTVLFGDLFTGWVRGLRADSKGKVTFDRWLGHLGNVTAVRPGPDGYGYFLTLDGQLHRALPKFVDE